MAARSAYGCGLETAMHDWRTPPKDEGARRLSVAPQWINTPFKFEQWNKAYGDWTSGRITITERRAKP